MGRLITGFLVSVATFLVGCAVVFAIPLFISCSVPGIGQLPPAKESLEGPKADDFAWEFLDLPNFAELDAKRKVKMGKLIKIFDDGIYRASEVVAKPGQSWLLLAKHGNRYSLQKSRASVKKLRSVSWPGDENDVRLNFSLRGKPIFAVRNISGLKPGYVTTIFHHNPEDELESPISEISDGYNHTLELGANRYILRVAKGLTKDRTEVAVLVIESGGVKQVVKLVPAAVYPDRNIVGTLLWAGDIDHDEKLDLFLDEYNEAGATVVELYLSSKAAEGSLVELAAVFVTAGC